MDDTVLKVALAGLLHDIGKFMQRAELENVYPEIIKNYGGFCPLNDKKQYGYLHAAHTAYFIETYVPENLLDKTELYNGARHHKNSSDDIYRKADGLSAGMDRLPNDDEDDIKGRDGYKKIRMDPVLGGISLPWSAAIKGLYKTELKPLSLERDDLFPTKRECLDPEHGALLVESYRALWNGFEQEVSLLPQHDLASYLHSMLYLMEKYTWCIPSSTMHLPDISLYDHAKTTAAIAVCLHDYSKREVAGKEGKWINERNQEKFLLVCGDMNGIQKFIYRITAKGAAKGLKGRSFLVQLLAEAIARHLLRRMDYPLTNLLYSGGGRFYLLVAAGHGETIERAAERINHELLKRYGGDLLLAIGQSLLHEKDFKGSAFPVFWEKAANEANKRKKKKFSFLSYDELFAPIGEGAMQPTCAICRKELYETGENRAREEPGRLICPDCRQAESVAENLSRARYLIEICDELYGGREGIDFPFLGAKYYLCNDVTETDRIQGGALTIYRLNDTDFLLEENSLRLHKNAALGFHFIAGTEIPVDEESRLLTFTDLAKRSEGITRLGVLRMDVDNLGTIFSRGFGDHASISRVAALSRGFSLFFNGYLNRICQGKNLIVVYAGGDDLFIVGPWNAIADIAPTIREELLDFCCHNPSVTLSGGIAMIPSKYPIYKGAEHAGEAEKLAKSYSREDGREKNAVAFLGKVQDWQEMEISKQMKNLLVSLIEQEDTGKKNKGILNRLRSIYLLFERNKNVWNGKDGISMQVIGEKIHYSQWMWRAVYSLARTARGKGEYGSSVDDETINEIRDALLNNEFNGMKSPRPIIDYLDVPIRWAEFLTREEA